MCKCVDSCCIYIAHLTFTLSRSSEIPHFKHRDVIEIRKGIIFVFYPELPHIPALIATLHSKCCVSKHP